MSKGMGPLGDIMKQAQELQERLGRVQEEAAAKTVEASAGGGMVSARVSGKLELVALRIDPELVKSGDVEMLQDLVLVAVNQAVRQLALTRVIVAHRPETIASAGRVIAMAEGRVAQDLRSVASGGAPIQ